MSLRIRESGEIVCAAMHQEMPGDTYLHDGISYRLTVEHGVIVSDRFHLRASGEDDSGPLDGHGLWWWRDEVPEGVVIEECGRRAANPAGGAA